MLDRTYKDTREETELNYKDYLQSEHWKALRKSSFSRCFVCHCSGPLELHHRIGSGDERDVIAVCREHHQEIHSGISVRLA